MVNSSYIDNRFRMMFISKQQPQDWIVGDLWTSVCAVNQRKYACMQTMHAYALIVTTMQTGFGIYTDILDFVTTVK